MIVKNININSFTSLAANDLIDSIQLLDSNYIDKNIFSSNKLAISDLSASFVDAFSRDNVDVKGSWTFKNQFRTVLSENLSAIPNIFALFAKYEKVLEKIYELSNEIYINGRMQSYPGIVIATTLSTEAQVKERYRGKQWQNIAEGRFIVGADKSKTLYGVPKPDGKDTFKLDAKQIGIPAHTHDFNGGGGSGNKNVKNGNRIGASIHCTHHSKAGASKPAYSAALLQAYCQGRMAKTSKTYSFSGKTTNTLYQDFSQDVFDNRPNYIPIFFWQRLK